MMWAKGHFLRASPFIDWKAPILCVKKLTLMKVYCLRELMSASTAERCSQALDWWICNSNASYEIAHWRLGSLQRCLNLPIPLHHTASTEEYLRNSCPGSASGMLTIFFISHRSDIEKGEVTQGRNCWETNLSNPRKSLKLVSLQGWHIVCNHLFYILVNFMVVDIFVGRFVGVEGPVVLCLILSFMNHGVLNVG